MAVIHVGVTCWPRPQPSEVRDVIHSMFVVNSQFSRLCKLFQAGFDRAKLRERERESVWAAALLQVRLSNFLC